MKAKLYSMAVIAMMLCAGLCSCSKDEVDGEGGGSGKEKGHEYVDLGLPSGTKWATCNVGASAPAASGNYYAWGEVKPKSEYTQENYKWNKGEWRNFTKYCNDEGYGIVDNKMTLEMADDAARANWGGKWRMATYKEWKELLDYCRAYDEELNGVSGTRILAPNGNSIFLPDAGECYGDEKDSSGALYWTSSLNPEGSCRAFYYSGGSSFDYTRDGRYRGGTIRAVIGK